LERFDITFHKTHKPGFDEVPAWHRCTFFGVDYVHLKGKQHGDFFITRHGWEVIESLLPHHWFVGEKFSKVGRALLGATGAVYRVPVPHKSRPDFAIVVKFSRFCQSVGVTMADPKLNLSEEQIDRIRGAQFLSPFEEIGNLCRLRAKAGLLLPTEAPLAVYSPPTRYLDWQLGREPFLRTIHSRNLLKSQAGIPKERRVDYEWERQYILLYRWLEGVDAEEAVRKGMITEARMVELGREAKAHLRSFGWEVLDHKPRHVIIRNRRRGGLLTRREALAWGLVDYELLYPALADGG
jgi:hypothetical protein